MRHILITIAAIALSGCASIATDSQGNEARPFGLDITPIPASQVQTIVLDTRAYLIVTCHDLEMANESPDVGVYLSRDGLNCVIAYLRPINSRDKLCDAYVVSDAKPDSEWQRAVCSGQWRPGLM